MNKWKETLLDELVCLHIYNSSHEDDPRKALHDAITWNVEVALDPKVSQAAQNLIERGAAEERKRLLEWSWEPINVPACTLGACKNKRDVCDPAQHCLNTASYYTADQMAAAVLRERRRIAAFVEEQDVQHPKHIAAAIRSGA